MPIAVDELLRQTRPLPDRLREVLEAAPGQAWTVSDLACKLDNTTPDTMLFALTLKDPRTLAWLREVEGALWGLAHSGELQHRELKGVNYFYMGEAQR